MYLKIKKRIELELARYINELDKLYSLDATSPLLSRNIKEFILRDGKRIRPILFIVGYLGFSTKAAAGLYRSALSIELLHDFLLVHDDIIDKSDTRRGKPSMHRIFNQYLQGHSKHKFSGEDLAIVAGDVMHAMAMHLFLSVKEKSLRKEMALKKVIEAAIYTGIGEFLELISALKEIRDFSIDDIYRIYDLKTANYTFATPLAAGAVLGGADKKETDRLFSCGMCLGRAFQIKDDILGLFGEEDTIGKSNLTDIKEAKKTILIWYAYKKTNYRKKLSIEKILSKRNARKADLIAIRRIVTESGALDYAKIQIKEHLYEAENILASSKMRPKYKKFLLKYSKEILAL